MATRTKKLKRGKDWYKKLDPAIVEEYLGSLLDDPIKQLNDFFELDFKALVQECNGLKKAAARKAFIEPYKPFFEAVKKGCKSNPKVYSAPSSRKWQLRSKVYTTTQVVYGWLKHGHKYKQGVLNTGTTIEKLQALQDKCSNNQLLPPSFVESYLIYDGMSSWNTRFWGAMSFAPVDYIMNTNSNYLNKEQEEKGFIPFGADGGGNTWGVYSMPTRYLNTAKHGFIAGVYDKDHESPDKLQHIGSSFCDLIEGNHKLERV